jgi:hypothetical protein
MLVTYCWCLHHLVRIHVVTDRGICPFVTHLVPYVCWPERRQLRPAAADNLILMEVRGCKYIG